MAKVLVGTSGYNYKHWSKGVFYPLGLSQDKWLKYYCKFFNAVELNVSFYRLPKKETFLNWHKRTPSNFRFAVKGSRFITHIKRLKDFRVPLELFLRHALGLKEKLAVILWQLPPQFKKDIARLSDFCLLLKNKAKKISQVFEFRHASWFDNEAYDLLRKFNFCLCIAHSGNWPCVKEVTSNFLYLRFHGGTLLYGSNYSQNELKEWASFAKKYSAKGARLPDAQGAYGGKDIFAFFNNDAYGYAVRNALKFRELLEKRGVV